MKLWLYHAFDANVWVLRYESREDALAKARELARSVGCMEDNVELQEIEVEGEEGLVYGW
jgi:hypothetical protein